MKLVEKVITGYATTHTNVYQYEDSSFTWSDDIPNAFDWSPSNMSWRDSSASANVWWYVSSNYQWYLDGIGTFKSFLDDNFNDAYGGVGTEYTNFSCIPDGSELKRIDFLVRSSLPKYYTESVGYYKDGSRVSSEEYIDMKSLSSSGVTMTENRVVSGTVYNHTGHRFVKQNDGKFYLLNYTDDAIITTKTYGSWTTDDFKRGAFTARVRCKSNSNSANTDYWYLYSFSVKLYCSIPQYEVKVSTTKGGTATEGGDFFPNKVATITASPSSGYKFKYWNINGTPSGNTNTTLSLTVSADTTVEAVFEREACILYDTIFGYKNWVESGITSDSCEVTNITDEGFTLKSLHEGNDGYTNESPVFRVQANKKYIIEFDCEGTGWEVVVFFYPGENSPWNSLKVATEKSTLFETPGDCTYISIRVDANALGNVIRISNIRIYPMEYPYMSRTVGATQRTNFQTLCLPDRVVRDGYLFDGWNTKIDGSGTQYTENTEFPERATTLYSQWLLPIMFRGKFAKSIHNEGKFTDNMQLGDKVFPENPLYVPVKFLNYDGSVLHTKNVLFGHKFDSSKENVTDPVKPSDEEYSYQFSGWEHYSGSVKEIINILPKFTATHLKYSIKFGYYDKNNNLVVINEQKLKYKETPETPNPYRQDELIEDKYYIYSFFRWDSTIAPVEGDKVYIAEYTETVLNTYVLTWNIRDTMIDTRCPVSYIAQPPAGYALGDEFMHSDNKKYRVTGYTPALAIVEADRTYTILNEILKFTVTWKVGTQTESTIYEYGEVPTPPDRFQVGTTIIDGDYEYTIKEWNVSAVTGTITYEPVFRLVQTVYGQISAFPTKVGARSFGTSVSDAFLTGNGSGSIYGGTWSGSSCDLYGMDFTSIRNLQDLEITSISFLTNGCRSSSDSTNSGVYIAFIKDFSTSSNYPSEFTDLGDGTKKVVDYGGEDTTVQTLIYSGWPETVKWINSNKNGFFNGLTSATFGIYLSVSRFTIYYIRVIVDYKYKEVIIP